MTVPNAKNQSVPNNDQSRRLPEFVQFLVANLGLDPAIRYDLSPIRVSAKGRLDKLEDQEGTGIGVYSDREDFRALGALDNVTQRGWLPISYAQLKGSSRRVFAWVGVVGTTIFVAAADSAVEANLEPTSDDIAGLGRNAYVELFIAAARAGHVKNILLPFLSRIWRNDLWAEMLMAAINKHLPGCVVWEGRTELATYGSAKLVTSVKGHDGTAYVENLKEQTFEKGVRHVQAGGQWDRRESELPLGLGRERRMLADGTTTKSMKVVETSYREFAMAALKMRAKGGSWKEIGSLLAEHQVPMPGALGGNGRTFADYSSPTARTAGAKAAILNHLDYYRTGEWDEVRSVALPHEQIRGIPLEHDPVTGRRHTTVRATGMPWRPFLTSEEWTEFDKQEAADEARRKTGAAARKAKSNDLVSAFMGVSIWSDGECQLTLAPDSPTAYRLRSRPAQKGGWVSGDGAIVATLRRTLFHAGCGRALLDGLRPIEQQLAQPDRKAAPSDPVVALEVRVAELTTKIAAKQKASNRADEELEHVGADEDEAHHWRSKGREARLERRRLEARLSEAQAELAAATDQIVESIVASEADIAEPVLLASLLLDGTKKVPPAVSEMLDDYGITSSLRLERPDTRTGAVRATATARLPLLDGSTFDLPLEWDTPDSHNRTGDAALVPAMIRSWASGSSLEAVAEFFPDHDAEQIRQRLNDAFKRGGMSVKGLRIAALKCPVTATRQVIAGHILGDSALADRYTEEFTVQIVDAYFEGEARQHVSTWSDSTDVDDVRRVLASLADDHQGIGLNVDCLARNAGVRQALVRRIGRRGLLEKVGPFALRSRPCPASGCRGRLTVYVPTPETGSGLVCPRCWRAEGFDAVLGEPYIQPWVATAGGYSVAAPPAVVTAKPDRDRLLSVSEVAALLDISTHGVRRLDREGQLVPTERTGTNSGRLYSPRIAKSIPAASLSIWRERFGTAADDGLLGTADVAATLECDPSLVRDLANTGVLAVASLTAGGHRRYRREDVMALDHDGIAAYALIEIGEAAGAVGLPVTTLRNLADDDLVPSARTIMGQRRFDLGAVTEALQRLDLLGTADNPIVAIGQLAEHPDVALSTGQLRRLADAGLIPTVGRIGGKRRFRLQDVLDALLESRTNSGQHSPRSKARREQRLRTQ